MRKQLQRYLAVLGVLLFSAAVGCEGANEATVKGLVTIDAEPLTHGTVAFYAGSKNTGQAATGAIQPDGTFRVQTGQSGKLAPGEYAVTVTASTPSIPNPDGGPPTPGELITPANYASVATSGLRYSIRSGENTIDVVLVTEATEAGEADSPAGDAEGSASKEEEGSAEKSAAESVDKGSAEEAVSSSSTKEAVQEDLEEAAAK